MDRRNFIKLTAITSASTALASCGNPENTLIRFVPDTNVNLSPGIAEYRASVCTLCGSGCGVSARVMQADAEVERDGQLGLLRVEAVKKVDGLPDHPISQGRLCVRGQASVQATFHPDRITQPLRRVGAPGETQYEALSWEDAIAEVAARLDTLASDPTRVAWLRRSGLSHRRALVDQFLASYGARPAIDYEMFDDDVLRRANALSFGRGQLPTLDLARSRYVLSLGTDLLGTWNSPVAHSIAYGAMRQGRPGVRGHFVQAEARMSLTGANADEWVATRPGTEGTLALGIAHVILAENLRLETDAGTAGTLIDGWSAGLPNHAPDLVAEVTGVSAERIERLAREFASRTPAVAVIGGAPLAHTNGLASALVVNALNALVGSVGQPGGVFFTESLQVGTSESREAGSLSELAAEILNGEASPVDALFIDGTNPAFTAPSAWQAQEALGRVPFVVSFGSFLDETSAFAHLILPDHTALESWIDAIPESGARDTVASVASPAMRPLHNTRAMPDVLIGIGSALNEALVPLLPDSFESFLEATFSGLPVEAGNPWRTAQARGGWWGVAPAGVATAQAIEPAEPVAQSFTLGEAIFDGDAARYPFHLLPYPSQAFLDGSLAHLPWLQELPDPLTSAMWSSWVEINPQTAERLSVAEGDMLTITSSQGSLQAPALIFPGIAPDVVAIPMGQGHRMFTRYASGRGANPATILAPVVTPETGSLAWAATRVQVARTGDSDGSLILYAGELREDPREEVPR